MEILFILLSMTLAIVIFILGYKIGNKEQENTFEKEKQLAIQDINNAKKKVNDLESEYQSKRQLIKDAKTYAENEYNIKIDLLEDKYEQLEFNLKNQFAEEKEKILEQSNGLREELESLRKTKAATIEAFQKEEAIKEQADLYRLDISENDKTDVEFLRSIQFKISKPRILSMLIWQTYFQPLAKKKFPIILGSKDICGIYKITNILNNKVYIGQAVNIKDRFNQHCKCGLGIDMPQSNKLYNDMLKDGLHNFTFELLEECNKEELNNKEAYYIGLYNSCEFGYNSVKGTIK